MGDDILIRLDDLADLRDQLAGILAEFDSSGSESATLADEIGSPDGESELRQRVGDFHDNWKIHRRELAEKLQAVYDQVKNTHGEWTRLDEESAAQFEGAGS
ncbi:hypothetical protein [Agrococcus jejuensis]|uniref:Excreted virulence factor EspC, type VII ESX diderm n=1 Tax=Agrococcus jejuensis TaxID=399736 RepID=A0A1G8BST9_9MICO|nr:hypothetical protein [Agrococcus jejuensis]SDH36267.1 hypothetical protein SAMN04489720_1044 [Agrococcus jejuensis]